MGMREKDQADFDLEQFVDLFDTAMSSDNPAVKRALRNLLMIAAIVDAEENSEGLRRGPLRRVVEDIKHLTQRLNSMETRNNYVGAQPVPWPPTTGTPNMPTPGIWPTPIQSPTTGTPNFPPGTIWTTTNTATSYTAKDSGAKAAQAHMSTASLDGLYEKLEAKSL